MSRKNFVGAFCVAALGITILLSGAEKDTRVADAAQAGDKSAVRNFIAHKADVNAPQGDGTTALHWAASGDDVEMAQLLIQAGANVKAVTRLKAVTPLMMACKNGN